MSVFITDGLDVEGLRNSFQGLVLTKKGSEGSLWRQTLHTFHSYFNLFGNEEEEDEKHLKETRNTHTHTKTLQKHSHKQKTNESKEGWMIDKM